MPFKDTLILSALSAARPGADGGAKGLQAFLHLRVDRGHGGSEGIDLIEMKAQQEAMLGGCRRCGIVRKVADRIL
jgi:hypothetical protein